MPGGFVMNYTIEEVKQFVEEEDVKFIRLAFCDVFGRPKNFSIMPTELDRAFDEGIAIDAWSVTGFDGFKDSDILLHPDPRTLAILPWRPEHGRVVRMYCDITWPDGRPFECDSRTILIKAVEAAASKGYTFYFGTEQEFYLFKNTLEGERTDIPYDNAGYMDIAPEDKGENVRREICMTLEQMGISPESSHHEKGPGQNEIDFRYCQALKAADDAMTFRGVVRTIAARNGASADFGPKPIKGKPGNGMYIHFSVQKEGKEVDLAPVIAGIMKNIRSMSLFMNPVHESFDRLGYFGAPKYIKWGKGNRSALIRVPDTRSEHMRAELRSPDSSSNPYLVLALMIYAGLEGIEKRLTPDLPTDINLFTANEEQLSGASKLPASLEEAAGCAKDDVFLKDHIPSQILDEYLKAAK